MKVIKSKGGYYYKIYKNNKKKRISKEEFMKHKKTKHESKKKILKGGNRITREIFNLINNNNSKKDSIYNFSLRQIFESNLNFDECFELSKKIGQGGFGIVYLVKLKKKIQNLNIGEEVSLKVLTSQTNSFNKNKIDKKLLNEIKIGYQLEHPCIVRTHFFFTSDTVRSCPQGFGIVMEYFESEDLTHFLLKYNRVLNENEKAVLITQMLFGLEYMHHQEIMNRDIKPDNILVDNDLKLKFCDFGFSEKTNISDMSLGTNHYKHPNVNKNIEYDRRIDVWSLGCTIYYLLSTDNMHISQLSDVFGKDYHTLINELNTSSEIKNMLKLMLTDKPTLSTPYYKEKLNGRSIYNIEYNTRTIESLIISTQPWMIYLINKVKLSERKGYCNILLNLQKNNKSTFTPPTSPIKNVKKSF